MQPSPPHLYPGQFPPPFPPPSARRSRKPLWIILGVVAVMVAGCVGLVAIGSSGNGTPSVKADNRPARAVTYRPLTARGWAQINKAPDEHAGETYMVYGVVTQFDAATGQGSFLADVDGVPHPDGVYPTNTMLDGDSEALADLVEGDQFQADVTVAGSDTYQTQIGGSTTVTKLTVTAVKAL